MSLAASHSLPNKKDRKALPNRKGDVNIDQYERTENVINQIYCDITNAVSRSDCMEKLTLGLYGNKPVGKRQAAFYYEAALKRFEVDTDIEAEKLRNVFYTRYESLLADAIEVGDRNAAKGILDSMAKLFLGLDQPQNAIQVNANTDGVSISFAFAEAEKEDK